MSKILKLFLLAYTLCASNFIDAQNCNCTNTFNWLKETIEENDAGFQFVIDKKGEIAYQKHNDTFSQKLDSITNKNECVQALSDWLSFFRKGHLSIRLNSDSNSKASTDSIFSSWETFPYNKNEFEASISKSKTAGIEGIWVSPPYTIGIQKKNNVYIGFIINAEGTQWKKNQVKLKIKEKNTQFTAIYYMRNYSAKEFNDIRLIGDNYLQIGTITFKRKAPMFPINKSIELYYQSLLSTAPFYNQLSDKTSLLRIPSFSYSEKRLIDSVIRANWTAITSTENLIIDLRNNGGGSDESFAKLLPIIYTNPISTIGVQLLSTPLNNQRMADFISNPNWSEKDKKWAKEGLKKLKQHLGEFVNLDSTNVTIESFDTIYPFPKKVGILINEGIGSTTEQFLLAAKQSKKVKLFGTSTMGVLDISNMYFVDSPCKEYKLGYSLSKSMRIPKMTIDGKGIQPDYYINPTIPKYEWIKFTSKILNYKQ